MIKKIIGVALMLSIVIGIAGCGEKPENGAGDSINVAKNLSLEEGYIILTDDLGNDVKIKENPDYVSALFAVSTHYFAMFGDVDKVVSISVGNTRDYLFCEIFPEILEKKVVKGSNRLNFEELVNDPVPELIVINPEAMIDSSTKKTLDKLGIPVFILAFGTFEEQIASVEKISKIMGREEKAKIYIDYYNKTIKEVTTRLEAIPDDKRKTVYHAINELLRTDKNGTLSEVIVRTAGGDNIADDIISDSETKLTNKSYISAEELMMANPEYIFINGGDVYDYIEESPQFHSLKAYQEGKIYLLPLGISRWGHPNSVETPLVVLFIAKTLYPDLFSDINLEDEIKYFYSTMFNYDLSDEQVTNIIGGRVYKNIKGSGR